MSPHHFLHLILILFLLPSTGRAEPATVKKLQASDDGNIFEAYILPVGSEDRLAVRRHEPRNIAELSLLSSDAHSGGHIENIQWSARGRFLVFSTSSSGGHAPWNFRTYVFSRERWSFLVLDDVIAPVTSPTFKFTDPSHIEIVALKSPSSAIDDAEKRVVDLEALPWKTQKTEQAATVP